MRHNILILSSEAKLSERLQAAMGAEGTILLADPRTEDPDSLARRFDPGCVLIDANIPTGAKTMLERIAAVRAQFPALPLIVVGDEMSAQLILAAFRAGANDFLDRESSDMEIRALLTAALRDHAAKASQSAGASLVSVLSPGSSDEDYDLALNIAALLAADDKERRVLLLDLSLPASPAGPALGLELTFTVSAAVREMVRLDKTFLNSALARAQNTGLYVLPLADGASGATSLPSLHDLSVLLQILRGLFDTVVVYWGAFSRQATLSGPGYENQHLFLCCNQRFSSIRNAKEFLAELEGRGEPAAAPILAVHQFDPDIAPGPDDIVRATGAKRSLTLRTSWAALAVAQNRGQPVCLAGPSHYNDALRAHLAAHGLLSHSLGEARSGSLFHWLQKVRVT